MYGRYCSPFCLVSLRRRRVIQDHQPDGNKEGGYRRDVHAICRAGGVAICGQTKRAGVSGRSVKQETAGLHIADGQKGAAAKGLGIRSAPIGGVLTSSR